jgi:hypothetical protein
MFKTVTVTISDSPDKKMGSANDVKLPPEKQRVIEQQMDKLFDHMNRMFDDMSKMFDRI